MPPRCAIHEANGRIPITPYGKSTKHPPARRPSRPPKQGPTLIFQGRTLFFRRATLFLQSAGFSEKSRLDFHHAAANATGRAQHPAHTPPGPQVGRLRRTHGTPWANLHKLRHAPAIRISYLPSPPRIQTARKAVENPSITPHPAVENPAHNPGENQRPTCPAQQLPIAHFTHRFSTS